MYRAKLMRGQAEVIGATIALGLLLLAIASILILMQRTSTTTTANFAYRANFESEKQAENIGVIYDAINRYCILTNYGSLNIEIVRIWKDNTHMDYTIDLEPGESIIWNYTQAPQYIVTSRGNVVPVKSSCEQQKQRLELATISFITSRNILSGDIYLQPKNDRAIICNISLESRTGKGRQTRIESKSIPCYVAYNFSDGWYLYNFTVKRWIYLSSRNSTLTDPDLNNNNVNELTFANVTTIKISGKTYRNITEIVFSSIIPRDWRKGNWVFATINTTFINSIYIDNDTDVIYITYRIILNVTNIEVARSQGFSLSSYVVLDNGKNKTVFQASYNYVDIPLARFKRGIFATYNVTVVDASVVIPRKAYSSLTSILSPGIYNLTISIEFGNEGPNADKVCTVRIESVAVSGARIVWSPWSRSST